MAHREPAGEMAAFPLPPLETALDEPVAVDQEVENVVELAELLEDPSAQEPQLVLDEDELVELVVGSQDPQVVVVEDELDDADFVGTTVTVV